LYFSYFIKLVFNRIINEHKTKPVLVLRTGSRRLALKERSNWLLDQPGVKRAHMRRWVETEFGPEHIAVALVVADHFVAATNPGQASQHALV
jgi:hypothetical protein